MDIAERRVDSWDKAAYSVRKPLLGETAFWEGNLKPSQRGGSMFAKHSVLALMLAMFVGVLVSAVVPEPTAAQGCGWCDQRRKIVAWPPFKLVHSFPGGSNSCLQDDRTDTCSRCGTDLGCHTFEDGGGCHILCGPAGEPTALLDVVEEIRALLDAGDAVVAAAMVLVDRVDLTVAYEGDAGRINFTLPCDPAVPAATVAVLPRVRASFEAALAANFPAAVALGPRDDRILATPQ